VNFSVVALSCLDIAREGRRLCINTFKSSSSCLPKSKQNFKPHDSLMTCNYVLLVTTVKANPGYQPTEAPAHSGKYTSGSL
jgi:hypothetical protein